MNSLKTGLQGFLNQQSSLQKIVFVRKGLSLTNLNGQLIGVTDIQLSAQGRQQGKQLMKCIYPMVQDFDAILSSDLSRSIEFADISLGYNGLSNKKLLTIEKNFRETNFGKDEGLMFDMQTKEEKERVNSWDYKAEQGESWKEVQHRIIKTLQNYQQHKKLLVFMHGGALCSLTYELGLKDVIECGGVLGVLFDSKNFLNSKISLRWNYTDYN